jgi:hypothetical protein
MGNRKILGTVLIAVFLFSVLAILPVSAARAPTNYAGADKVAWHASAEVMPVPPYGSVDIPGAATASKLIVNEPNGNTQVTLTGVMKGLAPNTQYTVYISNGYTPYDVTGWNVQGSFMVDVEYLGGHYPENMVLTQSGSAITGTSLGGGPYPVFTIVTGTVDGNKIYFDMTLGGLTTRLNGTIAPDGSMSGTWADIVGGSRTGAWATTSGHAVATYTGDLGWPGMFLSTTPMWDVSGNWVLSCLDYYNHTYMISMNQVGGVVTGEGTYPLPTEGPTSIWETLTGSVAGNTLTLHGVYFSDAARLNPTGYTFDAVLAINPDGTLTGTANGYKFISLSGAAISLAPTRLSTFTFTTNDDGSATWHVNLKKVNLQGLKGVFPMSVWINGGGATLLISDTFSIHCP